MVRRARAHPGAILVSKTHGEELHERRAGKWRRRDARVGGDDQSTELMARELLPDLVHQGGLACAAGTDDERERREVFFACPLIDLCSDLQFEVKLNKNKTKT